MSVTINSIKFWMNAFIPLNVPGYTKPIPGHSGMTMIPGPNPISDCYHTDQRDFSNHIHASSRMHSEVRVDFSTVGPRMTQWHNCDETVECDCDDGDVECRGTGKTDRMNFRMLPPISSPTPGIGSFPSPVMPVSASLITIEMDCKSCNPCAPSSIIAGDIDYEGKILIDRSSRRIECDLKIDAFPAFEAYATINDGAGILMFQVAPPLGNTVLNLPGAATRPVQIRLEDRDGDGVFETRTAIRTP